ncbi:hypothetical protein [Aeromonas caviae]|nr:hypothetical protein [Aeromonas caviae]MXQ71143.1 hypothetical protein [Aeromonas caviae]
MKKLEIKIDRAKWILYGKATLITLPVALILSNLVLLIYVVTFRHSVSYPLMFANRVFIGVVTFYQIRNYLQRKQASAKQCG